MNRPSHYFPKSNFHLPDRNNSTDNQDAMKNTNEIKRAPKTRKKSTEDKKNYKTMDLERDKKEALTENFAKQLERRENGEFMDLLLLLPSTLRLFAESKRRG
ncbi:hypothetical protein E5288_WYG012517 [Bos mutus]|uniref:Uncharacterized protein n=1 Tax=Bos mutus TaxID=72004 RepID=A0A6B0QX11_9CETA|nr:hypothetical protein [Bos mutus]